MVEVSTREIQQRRIKKRLRRFVFFTNTFRFSRRLLITLTIKPDIDINTLSEAINKYFNNLKQFCKRRKANLYYAWVVEKQSQYHIHSIILIDKNIKIPYPDQSNWKLGLSNVKTIKRIKNKDYLFKYLIKSSFTYLKSKHIYDISKNSYKFIYDDYDKFNKIRRKFKFITYNCYYNKNTDTIMILSMNYNNLEIPLYSMEQLMTIKYLFMFLHFRKLNYGYKFLEGVVLYCQDIMEYIKLLLNQVKHLL